MAVDLAELQIELETDPNGYGYAPFISEGMMTELSNVINLGRPELPHVDYHFVHRWKLQNAVARDEYFALPLSSQLLWDQFTHTDLDMIAAPGLRDQIEGLFEVGSSTLSVLASVFSRESTRAEELWGVDTIVTWEECAAALALP